MCVRVYLSIWLSFCLRICPITYLLSVFVCLSVYLSIHPSIYACFFQGIPVSVQQLIDAGKNSDLYNNTRKSMWKPSKHTVVTEDELTTLDTVLIRNHVTMAHFYFDSEKNS